MEFEDKNFKSTATGSDQPDNFNNHLPNFLKKHQKSIYMVVVVALILILTAVLILVLSQPPANEQQLDNNQNLLSNQSSINPQKKIDQSSPNWPGSMSLKTDKTFATVGDLIEVELLLDTQGANIVVAGATIEFDPDFLKLENLSQDILTENSVMKMAISKTVTANQIVVVRGAIGDGDYLDADDGFTGDSGLLAKIKFKAIKDGVTDIKFLATDSNMVLDDARGTLLNTSLNDLQITIN